MDRAKFIKGIEGLVEEINSDHAIARLEEMGFSKTESEVFRNAVPEAFAVPVLEDLGVSSIDDTASARNVLNKWVSVKLADIPIFVQALELAREHRAVGVISQEAFVTIARSSALVDTANKALNDGTSLDGASVSICFIGARATQLVGAPWYKRLFRRD